MELYGGVEGGKVNVIKFLVMIGVFLMRQWAKNIIQVTYPDRSVGNDPEALG